MSKRNKLLSWANRLFNKTQPTPYCSLSDWSSEEDLYEDIENYTKENRSHWEPGTAQYNQYLREYFFALRDSHINRKRLAKSTNETASESKVLPAMVPADYGEPCDQYQFLECELKKRPRGNVCLPERPRICVCSCETINQKPITSPRISNISPDAGWVFCTGSGDMRKLARRSNERLKDALFASGD